MKFIKFLFVFLLLMLMGCSKKEDKRWNVDVNGIGVNVEVIDISKDFYHLQMPLSEFRTKYPFYLDANIPDMQYEKQRRDTIEQNIYKQIKQKIDNNKIKEELSRLFRYGKYYYPDFKEPKVFLYSSFCQDYLNPVTYIPEKNYLFIATDCFLGENNRYYNIMRIERYLQATMTPQYLSSKVAREIALTFIPKNLSSQNFVSYMIYNGKILTLEDAFLPDVSDEYKIGYTKQQINWAKSNEFQIWNYFIQNNYVFSDDTKLGERFLSVGPFSKFYNDIERNSPGQIGCWVGWQICRKYLFENPKISLHDFIKNNNGEDIFAKSEYKPKEVNPTK